MNENFQKLEKKKILAILGSNREMYKMCSAKIYTSNREGESWLYSDLEGFLCFVLDYNIKTRFLVMFDPTTYERLFQFELYNNFEREYQKLADDFFCFDVGNSFIGFKFDDPKEASELHDIIKKFNDFLVDNLFDANLKSNNVYNFKKQEIIVSYLEIIKEKFSAAKNKFNEDYIEDGMEIRKPRYFELLNNIAFDREKKEFKIGKLPQEFKNMFKNIGIKKSDIKDPKSALNIIKNVIDILDNQADDQETVHKFGKAFKKTIAKLKNKKKGSISSTQNASGPINFNKTYGEDVNPSGGNENNSNGIENITLNSNTITNTNINTNANPNTNPNPNIPAIPSVPKLPNTNIKTTPTVVTPAGINTTQTPTQSTQVTQVNTPTQIPSIPSVPKVPAIPAVPLIPSVPKVPNIHSVNLIIYLFII
jgi:hypothetical protein